MNIILFSNVSNGICKSTLKSIKFGFDSMLNCHKITHVINVIVETGLVFIHYFDNNLSRSATAEYCVNIRQKHKRTPSKQVLQNKHVCMYIRTFEWHFSVFYK